MFLPQTKQCHITKLSEVYQSIRMSHPRVSLLLLFIASVRTSEVHQEVEKCVAFVTPHIQYCKTNGHPRLPQRECVQNSICNKTFNATVIKMKPHSNKIIPHLISHFMQTCCGSCSPINVVRNVTGFLNFTTLSSSHFVYPVIGYASHTHMYGFSFMPLVEQVGCFIPSTFRF